MPCSAFTVGKRGRLRTHPFPLSCAPQWGWFSVALFFNYGDSFGAFIENRKIRFVPPIIVHYLRYHTWISFTMYAGLFVMSVLSLKKGAYVRLGVRMCSSCGDD